MKRPSALVTGATGFVGKHLAASLTAEGWDVHAVVRAESSAGRIAGLGGKVRVHRFGSGVDSMREVVREARPDVVFHLASLFLSEHKPDDVEHLVESNVAFGALLVESMCLEGVRRLVNTGTSWQHYRGQQYCPVNLYAATKQAFEDVLEYYVEARGISVVTLKLFDTYGPDDPRDKLVSLLLRSARTGAELAMSGGEQLIDLVHVDDVVRAYLQAASLVRSAECKGHQRFGVSSGAPISLRQLVSELEQVVGGTIAVSWGERPYREREVMSPWRADAGVPGWRPTISLRDGLKTLV